jgi:glycosyltransferase involved in cell wall biosynthesis
VSEVVRHEETGLLAVPGNQAHLAECIVKLIREPATRSRLARAGRELVEKEYNFEHMLDLTEALYADLLQRE